MWRRKWVLRARRQFPPKLHHPHDHQVFWDERASSAVASILRTSSSVGDNGKIRARQEQVAGGGVEVQQEGGGGVEVRQEGGGDVKDNFIWGGNGEGGAVGVITGGEEEEFLEEWVWQRFVSIRSLPTVQNMMRAFHPFIEISAP